MKKLLFMGSFLSIFSAMAVNLHVINKTGQAIDVSLELGGMYKELYKPRIAPGLSANFLNLPQNIKNGYSLSVKNEAIGERNFGSWFGKRIDTKNLNKNDTLNVDVTFSADGEIQVSEPNVKSKKSWWQ